MSIKFLEDYFLHWYIGFLIFMGGLFIGSEIRLIQLDRTHREYVTYIEEIKNECNTKIAQAKGLE